MYPARLHTSEYCPTHVAAIALLALLGLVAAGHAAAQPAAPETLNAGAPGMVLRLETRFRYVYIEEGDKPLPVDVTTARAVVGADVTITPRLKATMEIIHSDYLPPKRFTDDPVAFASPYPLLPDPRYTGLNETHLTWTPTPDWSVRVGRQSMRLGNERHLSDDNFRQIPQLFDGLSVRGSPADGTQLTLGQFNRLRTRFGTTESMQLTLMELAANPVRDMALAGYAIRHRPQANAFDIFRFGVADLSNWVVGAIVDGSHPLFSDLRGYYTFNLADQRSTDDAATLRARYWRAGLGAGWRGLVVRADHEVKGSNGGRYGFQTPLTNQYAFNGNSLTFFDTPVTGLRDSWATLRWEQGPWSALGEYHRFSGDYGNRRYGQEFDANVTYTISPRAYVRAQWARYRPAAGGFGTDVDKVWLTVGYDIK